MTEDAIVKRKKINVFKIIADVFIKKTLIKTLKAFAFKIKANAKNINAYAIEIIANAIKTKASGK